MKINSVDLKLINDSRGDFTIECYMKLNEEIAVASVPSGKSKGASEAFVQEPEKALEIFKQIKSQILATDFNSLFEFDNFLISLDGTANKQRLGGNLILALSIAFVKCLSRNENMQIHQFISKISNQTPTKFPVCFFNLIEGGLHVKTGSPFQEYMFIPNTQSPKKALQECKKIMDILSNTVTYKVSGDEGGLAPENKNFEYGLRVLLNAIVESNLTKSRIGLDVAASSFYQNGKYMVSDSPIDGNQLLSIYKSVFSVYPLLSIEDPFAQNDPLSFKRIMAELGNKLWIVGDDLTATNKNLIEAAYKDGQINAVIIKPNQIGSVSETIQAVLKAKELSIKTIVSHRSGETTDSFISDLAFGLCVDGIKVGAPTQKERLVKYERLIEIEASLSE